MPYKTKSNTAVHCPTLDEFDRFVAGISDVFGSPVFTRNVWNDHLSDTCINVTTDQPAFSTKYYYQTVRGYSVISIDDYFAFIGISTPVVGVCPDCKGTKQYQGFTTIEPCKTCCPPATGV